MNLREQYAAARKAAQDIHDQAVAENRPMTAEERTDFDAKLAEAKQLKELLDQIDTDQAELRELTDAATGTPAVSVLLDTGRPRSLGEVFTDSDEYKAMLDKFGGQVPDGARAEMPKVRVGGFRNALLTDPALYPVPHRLAPAELAVIDLFDAINVVEDAPTKVQIDRATFTNAAAVYTEGSDSPKAESQLVFTPDVVTLDPIAHHLPVTTQALNRNAMLRNRIDTYMVNGVRAKAQAEVAATLLASVALMQTQAFVDDYATTLRKAITKAQRGILAIGGDPTIRVLMAPEDHEALDLELLDALVAMAGQNLTQTATIWRAQVIPVFGLPAGVAFVGDSKQVDFYVGEEGLTVRTGWVDKQFIQNRLTILAEMEAKAAVIGGAALVATDLNSSAPPDFS